MRLTALEGISPVSTMKLITRHTRAPRVGALIRCPHCEHVSLVRHFAWSALACQNCGEMVAKDRWAYCERTEVDPVEILRLGSPVTLCDQGDWCTWLPDGDRVISMYGKRGIRNRVEDRVQISLSVALTQVRTHLEYGWKIDSRGKGAI